MMPKFIERAGSIYRVLKEVDAGCWVISYSDLAAPLFLSNENIKQFRRVPAPDTFQPQELNEMTPAQRNRLALIQPLLENPACMTDRAARTEIAAGISAGGTVTVRRILQMYYRFLATGRITSARTRSLSPNNSIFDWAIRTYYYSAKQFSLRTTYEIMLLEKFTDGEGGVRKDAPTWSQFRHYFYRRRFHKDPQKTISREGLTAYQRNYRPAFGSAAQWRTEPGSFQMDATPADIYLVSRHDRSTVVGRPYIYMAVDTATQLITGIYVGFSCDETAVMACLAQSAGDKVEYCKEHEIEIAAEQWPNSGLPREIITDKGREFFGPRMEELCRCYGIEVQTLPPFRPDRKGIVEKSFDLLQGRYKPLLRGKGVIEEDAQERWAVDYRTQAVLDLEEFTQVIIYAVLYLNSGRRLPDGRTPAQKWMEASPHLLEAPAHELYRKTLPRISGKLTRKGFRVNRLWYYPSDMENLALEDSYTLAYDPSDTAAVFLVLPDGGHRPCLLQSGGEAYKGGSLSELDLAKKEEREARKAGQAQEDAASMASIQAIRKVVREASQGHNQAGG